MKYNVPPTTILYVGRLASTFGNWVFTTALSLAVARTHASFIPWIWFFDSITLVVMGPIMGAIADRTGIRKSILIADLSRMVILAFVPLLYNSKLIFVVIVIIASASALSGAALNPLITILGGAKGTYKINSVLGSIQSSSQVVGPMLGGTLFIFGINFAFWLQSLTFLASAICVGFIVGKHVEKLQMAECTEETETRSVVSSRELGIGKLIGVGRLLPPVLLLLMVTNSIFSFGSSIVDANEVLFITKGIGLSPLLFSVVVSFGGVAYFLASLFNIYMAKHLSTYKLVWVGMVAASLGNVIYALAGGIFQLIIGICMLAVGTTLFFTTYRTMVQKFSPIRLQGRISGVVSVLPKGLGLISVAMSSLLISVLHIKQVILIGALITVIAIPFALLSSLHSNIADASVDSCE